MKFKVWLNKEVIGESNLEHFDDGMGVASGEFFPNDAYKDVKPIFRLFSRANLEVDPEIKEKLAKEYYEKRDALNLSLTKETGERIPVGFIHIIDFLDEIDIQAIEIEIQISDPSLMKTRYK